MNGYLEYHGPLSFYLFPFFIRGIGMTNNERKTFSIVADPSSLLSFPHLQDLMKVLEDLEEQGANFKVVVSNMLHSSLDQLEKGLREETIEVFAEIYQAYLPSESKQDALQKLRDLAKNNEYKALIKKFRERYSPENAEKYAYREVSRDEQELIDKLFTRKELDEKLRSTPNVSRVLYEE